MYVSFNYEDICDSYEEQANEQGFTLGEDRELLEKLGSSIVFCRVLGLLTDSQYSSALKKLQKRLTKALKPLPEPPKEEEA